MGAFNVVLVEIESPDNGCMYPVRIQFKYGDVRQYEYELGDHVKWGGNDEGIPCARRVVVDGCLEGDPPSGSFPEDYEIYITNNIITSVVPATGRWNFGQAKSNFIQIE